MGGVIMSRVCSVCQKQRMGGNKVSHSHRKSTRSWKANVQKVAIKDKNGSIKNVYVCTRCLRNGAVERV